MPLIDPENPSEEWEETVKAKNLDAAWSACEQLIKDSPLTQILDVTQQTKTPDAKGRFKFVCWFRSEVRSDDGNSDN